MRLLVRVLLALCLVIALARAGAFLWYAAEKLQTPREAYHLEAKSAHLAWRVQAGEALYPDWAEGPLHVANFFGPLYFLIVGGVARLVDADLPALLRIGRLTTLASGVIAAVVVGVASGRREGLGAGIFAGLMAIGAAPMVGYGAMVRPDVLADLLGFAGFLLAAGSRSGSRRQCVVGGALLVAALFAKQTTGLYLVASVLALIANGHWRRGVALSIGCAAASALIVAAVSLTVAPRFAADLAGESGSPWSVSNWRTLLRRFWLIGREIPLLSAIGFGLWAAVGRGRWPSRIAALAVIVVGMLTSLRIELQGITMLDALILEARAGHWPTLLTHGTSLLAPLAMAGIWASADPDRGRDVPLATLTVVLLLGSILSALKLGSDLNYFLAPRLVAAMAAGAAWGAASHRLRAGLAFGIARGLPLAVGLLALGYVLIPGLTHDIEQAKVARTIRRFLEGPGRPQRKLLEQILERAADPDLELLTDDGYVQLWQGARAPFADPWLFRVMVESGRIQPDEIRSKIEQRSYDFLVTSEDLDDPSAYDSYDFRLPRDLAVSARRNYRFVAEVAGLFLFEPRPDPDGGPSKRPEESPRAAMPGPPDDD